MNPAKDTISWGVLSTANIGRKHVIPAMQLGEHTRIKAIASRNLEKAREVADELQIEKAYGSYEELLEDSEIEAIYIPLPNHMHLEWITKCVKAGKHVLCEKPMILDSNLVKQLKELEKEYNRHIGEAFMVLHQPRWQRVKEIFQSGSLGKFVSAHSVFSYFNDDPGNIRNIAKFGGGGVWDIGCYPVVLARYVLGEEPSRIAATMEYDASFGTDRLASVIMDFPSGPVSFTVSTQMVAYQYFQFFGTEKMLEISTPFNTPDFRAMTIRVNSGNILELPKVAETFSPINQYTKQGDAFSRSILFDEDFEGSIDNAEKNCKVLEAVYKAASTNTWVELQD